MPVQRRGLIPHFLTAEIEIAHILSVGIFMHVRTRTWLVFWVDWGASEWFRK